MSKKYFLDKYELNQYHISHFKDLNMFLYSSNILLGDLHQWKKHLGERYLMIDYC